MVPVLLFLSIQFVHPTPGERTVEKLASVITRHYVIHKMASVTVPQFSDTLVKHATAPAQLDVLVAHALQCVTAQRNKADIKCLANVSAMEATRDVVLL